MVAEEAYARARTCQYDVKTGGVADVSKTAPVTMEANTRRRIMHQYDVHALTCSEPFHLVVGIVALRVASKRCRFARVVGRGITPANSAETDCLALCAFQFNLASVAEVNKSGQHLGVLLRIKPHEVLVVSLDEYGATRHRTCGHEPLRKNPRRRRDCVIRGPFFRIRPNAEVTDMQYPIEARAERGAAPPKIRPGSVIILLSPGTRRPETFGSYLARLLTVSTRP